jgi:chromosomal replication initiator protein
MIPPGSLTVADITIRDVQDAVCHHFGLHPIDMVSQRQGGGVAWPRQVAMYLATRLTTCSLPMIGHHFGNRDHSTVTYAAKKVSQRMQDDPELADTIQQLVAQFGGEA